MESKSTEKDFRLHFGIDTSTIDSKGRVSFGKKKAEWLGDDFVFMIGMIGVLEAIPTALWKERMQEVAQISSNNPGRAAYMMLTFNTSEPGQSLDKEGRIVIPVDLREEGGLMVAAGSKLEIKLVGTGDGIQIWPAHDYIAFKKQGIHFREERTEQIQAALKTMREFAS